MVAITVILAAVIGTFVLGLGDQVESAPQASITFSEADSELEINHRGGETIETDNVEIRVDGDDVTDEVENTGENEWGGEDFQAFSAGQTAIIDDGQFEDGEREDVDLVFVSDGREDIIASFTTSEDFGD